MIRKAEEKDAATVAALAGKLWPGHSVEELEAELTELLQKEDAAVFLLCCGEEAAGFAQCGLRRDYVEGTSSSPVGYLEGIYVAEECRKQGIAKALLTACESWAKSQGCAELASDCEINNGVSLQFHKNVGFEEVNRIICFTKKL